MAAPNIIAAPAGLRRGFARCAIVLALVVLSGCGQKGKLYLPDEFARYSQSE